MICSPILALLALCTMTPEPPPVALPLAEEAVCMTRAQARAKYPKDWLYWHGKNHCWDNRAPARRIIERTRAQRPEPKAASVSSHHVKATQQMLADASGNTAARRTAKIEIYYPALMREQAAVAADLYAVQRPITEWPLMLDLDAAGPDPDNGIDGCCWPPMETLR